MMSVTGKKRSFTLVELIAVVAIVTILVAMSFPSLRSALDYLQVSVFSESLRSFMGYLRERSVAEGEILVFSVDTQLNKCYASAQGQEYALRSLSIPDNIKLQPEPDNIMFYPDGRMDKFSLEVSGRRDTVFTLASDRSRTHVKINP